MLVYIFAEHISLEELTSESDTDKRKKKPSKAAPNNKGIYD